MNRSELFQTRDVSVADKNFIFATFLRGLYYGESWFTLINKQAFMQHYHKVIEYILNKPETVVKVCCLKEDPDTILGYSIYEADKLHFVFVKKNYRKIGIAKSLVPSDIKTVTHLTKLGLVIIHKRPIDFNPFNI